MLRRGSFGLTTLNRRTPFAALERSFDFSIANFCGLILFGVLFCGFAGTGRAATLLASGSAQFAGFGESASISGTIGLIGARGDGGLGLGSAYVFRNLDTATGTVTQNIKLNASSRVLGDYFGIATSLSGTMGLVGAIEADIGDSRFGSAYLFRNLNTASGTVTQNARLRASGLAADYSFGSSVSLSGTIGLVGTIALGGPATAKGSAYLFRNLDTASGTITQNATLTSAGGVAADRFGRSVTVLGNLGLVGAPERAGFRGSVYLFRNLNTITGTVTESATLTASDRAAGDQFGGGFSLSGNLTLVAAAGAESHRGSAYLFRNLDAATGTVVESAKLLASDGAVSDRFGGSHSLSTGISISGNTGIVGADGDMIGANANQGSAYLFLHLDTATGVITEDVKLTASDGIANRAFGTAVGIDGDRFVIGAPSSNSVPVGKAYTGTVSSVTTLDTGNESRSITGLSFFSRADWIIGETTDANLVTLGLGDTAEILEAGKAVYIGRNAGSDANTLRIDGTLRAAEVYIGSLTGNAGNVLQLEDTATFAASAFRLAPDNLLKIEGNFTTFDALLTYLGSTSLQVWDGGVWRSVDNSNHADSIALSFNAGYTEIASVLPSQPVPLPTLTIIQAVPGTATLAWQPASPGFVLQENATLESATWQNSPSGAQNPVTVPAGPGNRFFRLRRP